MIFALLAVLASAQLPAWMDTNADMCWASLTPTQYAMLSGPEMGDFQICANWASNMDGAVGQGGTYIPFNQKATLCAIYHCLENFMMFDASQMDMFECYMSQAFASDKFFSDQGANTWTFVDNLSPLTGLMRSDCSCNAALASAVPYPAEPQSVIDFAQANMCFNKVESANAIYFGCNMINCVGKGAVRDYVKCTVTNYYGGDSALLDKCTELDMAILANSTVVPLAFGITGSLLLFFAITSYLGVSCCKKTYVYPKEAI